MKYHFDSGCGERLSNAVTHSAGANHAYGIYLHVNLWMFLDIGNSAGWEMCSRPEHQRAAPRSCEVDFFTFSALFLREERSLLIRTNLSL